MSEREFASVLDASALLALLHAEPGAEVVEEALEGAVVSAVNWSEVVERALAHGAELPGLREDMQSLVREIVPFDAVDAEQAAALAAATRRLGLSLGDRACLALAGKLRVPALTADRAWLELEPELGIEIRLIR